MDSGCGIRAGGVRRGRLRPDGRTGAPSPLSVSSLQSTAAAGSASVLLAGDSTILAADSDTVIVRSVDLVVRRIKLEPVAVSGCESDSVGRRT